MLTLHLCSASLFLGNGDGEVKKLKYMEAGGSTPEEGGAKRQISAAMKLEEPKAERATGSVRTPLEVSAERD